MLIRRHQQAGFSNQQALLVLLICFPIGLIFLGLVVVLLQKPVPQAAAPAPSQPAPAAPSSPEKQPERAPSTESTEIQPRKPVPPTPSSGLSQTEARAVVEEWLTVKSQIFAPPFDTDLADRVVANGPLWKDLIKPDGSIQWLRNNNSYYTYDRIRVDRVIRFLPSPTMPSIVVRVTENSVLNSPTGQERSANTNDWLYSLKQEVGRWKIWDYRKQ